MNRPRRGTPDAPAIPALMMTFMACTPTPEPDILIRGGTIYDGGAGAPFGGDVALDADTIAAVGDIGRARGQTGIGARGPDWRGAVSGRKPHDPGGSGW